MKKLFIPVLLGTARKGRYSEAVARYMVREVEKLGLATQLVDVREFVVGDRQAASAAWADVMGRADGLIVVTPEYNHGYPGELKMLLDEITKEYERKPVGLCGVSDGGIGGARVVEQLREVFGALGMADIKSNVYFSNVDKLFDEAGEIKEPRYGRRVAGFLQELAWWAEALRAARG